MLETLTNTPINTLICCLCEALEQDYRLYTVKSFRRYVHLGDETGHFQRQLDAIRNDQYDWNISFDVEEGRKYAKIMMNQSGSRSVHAFIDMKTGDVYKPASISKPAKGVRYNLFDKNSREECYRRADWSGSYLYIR